MCFVQFGLITKFCMGVVSNPANSSTIASGDMPPCMGQDVPGGEVKIKPNQLPFTADPLAQAPCTETYYRTQKRPEG